MDWTLIKEHLQGLIKATISELIKLIDRITT